MNNPHLKYASYIVRHKWFVFQAGMRTKASLWRLLKHDWSKMLPSEWIPYANYFYGGNGDEAFKESWSDSYDKAWLLHQRRNDHHWQWWILQHDSGDKECLLMSEAAWREMLADWMGAGRAVTGKWECAEWYAKNREKIQLHPDTRVKVESLMEELK